MDTSLKNAPDLSSGDRLSWGVVDLQVTDLERAVAFWTDALGLIQRNQTPSTVALGTQRKSLIVLHAGAKRAVRPGHTGLYHVAIGVPGQVEFSRMLARLITRKVAFSAVDHLMSKALYLADPDGLEIEITYETPERCARFGHTSKGPVLFDRDGRPHSGRERLDIAAELSHAEGAAPMVTISQAAFIAHLHLKVAQIEPSLAWFETLGFRRHAALTEMGFADMEAGGAVKHRLAMNTWSGVDLSPAPEDMARLLHYELISHDLRIPAGAPPELRDGLQRGRDPAGVDFTLRPHTSIQ